MTRKCAEATRCYTLESPFHFRCNAAPGRYTSPEDGYARAVSKDSSLAPVEDGELARRVAAGGARDAEGELFRRLAPRVRLYGLRHLRDPHAAADLVQQVLLMTLEALRQGKVREPERIASYVLGTCRMLVMEMRRGARRREELLETFGDREAFHEPPEPVTLDADRLSGCLEKLAERERSVLVASFFADKAADAVGAELGITAGNVRVIRHRALGKLRECLGINE